MSENIIPVAIVDDHKLVRESIGSIINSFKKYQVVISAANGIELIDLLKEVKTLPKICVLDIQMPKMNGFETLEHIRKDWPELRVLALSMLDDEFSIIRMLRGGAKGYLLKGEDIEELRKALDCIYQKGFYSSELVSSNFFQMAEDGKVSQIVDKITEKEQQFLKYCCSEYTLKEIAAQMGISFSTAQGYRSTLFNKLNLKSRQGLAIFAIKSGIVTISEL